MDGLRNVELEPEADREGAGEYDLGRAPRNRLRKPAVRPLDPRKQGRPASGASFYPCLIIRFDTGCRAGVST